jgi:hypothetical protein
MAGAMGDPDFEASAQLTRAADLAKHVGAADEATCVGLFKRREELGLIFARELERLVVLRSEDSDRRALLESFAFDDDLARHDLSH